MKAKDKVSVILERLDEHDRLLKLLLDHRHDGSYSGNGGVKFKTPEKPIVFKRFKGRIVKIGSK